MVKSVSATYITQENRKQGARFVYAITYQKTAATKATIPSGEIIEAPVISNAIGRDFLALSGGDVQLVMSNRQRQWDDTYSGAYNRSKYDGDLRVYAGFALPSGGQELLELFSGKITNIEMSGVLPRNAVITARNNMADRLADIIGAASGATPNPYTWGYRQFYPLYQMDSATPSLYHVMHKGTLSVLGAVWKRRDDHAIWRNIVSNPASFVASKTAKTIRFVNATPGNQNAARIAVRQPGTHPVYIIQDIAVNQVKLPSSHINSTYLSKLRTIDPTTRVGVRFEDTPAISAIERLCHYMYAAAFIEGKKLCLTSLASPTNTGISLTESDYKNLIVTNDKNRIINQVEIPYYLYPLTTQIKRAKNATSQASYGSKLLNAYYSDFSYTVYDPIEPHNVNLSWNTIATRLQNLANTIIKYNAHIKRIFSLSNVYSKALRLELGDRVRLSNAFFGINQASAIVIGKTVNLNSKRTDLMLLSWP